VNKKLYIMMGIILVISVIAGGTLAYFTSSTNTPNNDVNLGSNRFLVDVTSTGPIDGALTLTTSKAEGLMTNVSVKMNEKSVLSKGNLYITINDITNNMINNNKTSWKKALIWELYGYNEQNEAELIDTGNFLECSTNGQKTCVNGDKLYMYKDFQLTYDYQSFDVYVWLDGNIADNGVEGAYLRASISAETEEFSADLR